MKKYNIPLKNVIRHKDITNRKIDLHDDFWNKDYKTFEDFKINEFLDDKNINMSKIYKEIERFKIFNTSEEDYNKNITA